MEKQKAPYLWEPAIGSRAHLLTKKNIQLVGEVVFGVPRLDCRGVGICKVSLPTDNQLTCKSCKQCKSTRVKILKQKNNQLEFHFYLDQLTQRMLRLYFAQPYFLVSESCKLPGTIQRALQTTKKEIKPGIYSIIRKEDRLIVRF